MRRDHGHIKFETTGKSSQQVVKLFVESQREDLSAIRNISLDQSKRIHMMCLGNIK